MTRPRRVTKAAPGSDPQDGTARPQRMKPLSYAVMTAWTRSRAPSFASTLRTWVLTVSTPRNSSAAISELDRSCAMSRRTSASRSVRLASASPRPGGPPRRVASRRMAAGKSRDSPLCTVRIALTKSSAAERNPRPRRRSEHAARPRCRPATAAARPAASSPAQSHRPPGPGQTDRPHRDRPHEYRTGLVYVRVRTAMSNGLASAAHQGSPRRSACCRSGRSGAAESEGRVTSKR